MLMLIFINEICLYILYEEKGTAEDEVAGWHHRFNGHEFAQTPGDSEGRGSLVCCSPWGCQRVGHDWASCLVLSDSLATPWTVSHGTDSSVHGISQARILEWVAISFSMGYSWPRDWICLSCMAGGFFTTESPGKPYVLYI